MSDEAMSARDPGEAAEPVPTAGEAADEAARPLGSGGALVPLSSAAGRALVAVIAIMTFLAALTAGAAQLVASASSGWRAQISREATIQVRPAAGRALDAEVEAAAAAARATPGVAGVRVYSKAESERLLEPWLGTGLDLDELPVPRVVVLTLDAARPPDLAALRRTLSAAAAGATLDDHRRWVERLAAMANTIVALGLGVVALVIAATGLAVAFATRGAMAGNREIVEVLHLVGASDGFIAGEFQRRFFTLGLHGGAIGGAAALLAFVLAGTLSAAWTATPEADQIEALFGSFSLGVPGLLAIVGIAALVAAVTALVSRLTVRRTLREIG